MLQISITTLKAVSSFLLPPLRYVIIFAGPQDNSVMKAHNFAYRFDYPTARRQVLRLYGHNPPDEKGLLYSTKQQMVTWLLDYWQSAETELEIVK